MALREAHEHLALHLDMHLALHLDMALRAAHEQLHLALRAVTQVRVDGARVVCTARILRCVFGPQRRVARMARSQRAIETHVCATSSPDA
jgi:hypothetical protein